MNSGLGCGTFLLAIIIFAALPRALGASQTASLWIGTVAAIVALFAAGATVRRRS